MTGTGYNQGFGDIVDNCPYTLNSLSVMYGVSRQRISAWCNGAKPQKKYQSIMEKIMNELQDKKKPVKHPSYGWATEDQINRLKEIGVGDERDRILAQIAKQTKARGKV